MKEDRKGLVLKPDDDRGWQRRGGVRGQQTVRIAKVENDFDAPVGGDVLLAPGRISPLMDPKALDRVLEDLVRSVLVLFHVPLLPGRHASPQPIRAAISREPRPS